MRRLLAVTILATAAFSGGTAAVAAPDAIFVHGQIYTPTGLKQAFAIEGSRIAAIGNDSDVAQLADRHTRVIDLKGATVLPGLVDMHVHPLDAGLATLQCRIDPAADAPTLLTTLQGCVQQKRPGEWVLGRAWQAGSLGSVPITRQTLDAVSPNNPVVLTDTSGHSRWLNTKALMIAGITRETASPPGGIVERDSGGEPTGVLREDARQLIVAKIPPYTRDQNAAALKLALGHLLSEGVTAFNDAKLLRANLNAYDDLSGRGELKQHVLGCIAYKIAPDFEQLVADRHSFERPNFGTNCVKVWVDGVPTEGHTGAMVEPYADAAEQPNAPAKGLPLVPQSELNSLVTRWDGMGLMVKFHVAGDQAVRSALDAVEAALRANGPGGQRHMLAHNSFVTARDIGRAKPLNATYEFGPYIWYPSPISEDVARAVGLVRMARAWPVKEALASGALVVAGSDWPIVADPNPWIGIETLVTRQRPGGGGQAVAPAERITVKQAFDMYTINAARALGVEKDRGTIEVGKTADFVIVDRNPLAVPVTEIGSTKVMATYIGGELVFQRSAR